MHEGGEQMDDTYEERVLHQFGGFCTKVLRNETRRIHNEKKRNETLEQVSFSLSLDHLNKIAKEDQYFQNSHVFEVHGMNIVVVGDQLAKVLAALPQQKRDIILLYYFPGLTDQEIAELMNVVRQNICKHRKKTLKELRKQLEKDGFEWP